MTAAGGAAPVRLGAKLPNAGEVAVRLGPGRMAAMLERAGFDSIWTSDHVVFPQAVDSKYPFSDDGRITWDVGADYLEPTVVLSATTSTTTRVELGTSVLILPLRNPVLFAKQAACIDVLSGGRLVLGVGVGWLREEFEALQAEFAERGKVLDEWLDILHRCWTGEAGPFEGRYYHLDRPIYCRPVPARKPPILIGGMSAAALFRAGGLADGWLAQYSLEHLSEERLARNIAKIQEARGPGAAHALRVVVRITGSEGRLRELQPRLGSLAQAGVTELIVDVEWGTEDGPERAMDALRAAG